eukprot:TRINITY_DN7076_c0_g2_i1.p1 TRINITY_DN7076_c0_g2~~TRINITY_DN7076_c0_g2_i1.p1  ORF type:complete len:290 (+),score=51.70 TRINITY_DN7076_c0_g2_i1:121-990(+)
MRSSILLLCLASVACCVFGESVVGPGCTVSVSSSARAGATFQSGSGMSQIYDIVVTNAGRCPVSTIGLNVAILNEGAITERWNLDIGDRYYLVSSFGAVLPVGNTVNAGIIVNFPNTQTIPANSVGVNVYGTLCPSECVNAEQPSTSAAAASASATTGVNQVATTSSVPPASATTSASASTTGSSATCSTISMSSKIDNQWQTGVQRTVTITNSGSVAIRALNLVAADPYATPNGQYSVTQLWGLTEAGAQRYSLPSWVQSIPAGGSISFGYVQNTFESVEFRISSMSC